jgi:hypothetical protein
MGKQNRITLKNYFQTGKVPTQGNYTDLIDSFIALEDSEIQVIQGGISSSDLVLGGNITASGNISASGYVTASELLGNIKADYIQMPFNKDVIIGSGGIPYSISASGNFRIEGSASFGGDITASNSFISASEISAISASFSHIKGNSPITFKDPTIFQSASLFTTITASGDLKVNGTVFGTVSSGTGAQTGITSLGTQTVLNVKGPTDLSGSLVVDVNEDGVIPITGSLSASGHITAEGKMTAALITAPSASFTNITGSISGSITGDIVAKTLKLGGTTITSTATELNKLDGATVTTAEINHLGGVTETNATVVKTLNQHLTTTATPTFAGLLITISNSYIGTYTTDEVSAITTAGLSFNLEIRSLEVMRGKFNGVSGWSGQQYMRVVNEKVGETSTILITPIGDHSVVSANPIRIQSGGFYLTFENDGLGVFGGGTQNYVVRVIL